MSSACPHTAFIPLRLDPNEGVILSSQSISFTCPIVYLSLSVVFYRRLSCFTGFGEMRYRERVGNKDVCLLWSFTAICVCWSLWESLLAFTLRCVHTDKHAPAHAQKHAQEI